MIFVNLCVEICNPSSVMNKILALAALTGICVLAGSYLLSMKFDFLNIRACHVIILAIDYLCLKLLKVKSEMRSTPKT